MSGIDEFIGECRQALTDTLPPHDHLMWAVIGIYGGDEHRRFYRRGPAGLVASGAKQLAEGETVAVRHETIHAVTNPNGTTLTRSIHVYGGDYLNKPRGLWNPDTLVEDPATGGRIRAPFEVANESLERL
jgi:predicted metal-dependent enzyme (double-stranded beta helix superfamily)